MLMKVKTLYQMKTNNRDAPYQKQNPARALSEKYKNLSFETPEAMILPEAYVVGLQIWILGNSLLRC